MKKPWRYKLARNAKYSSFYLEGVEFENAWVAIKGGTITIRAGYAWDGCSPKLTRPVLGLWHLGVPDGPYTNGYSATYFASLVHDALCQFRADHGVSRANTTALFRRMLEEADFEWRGVYGWAVDKFGPRGFKGGD